MGTRCAPSTAAARPPLPLVLGPRVADRLPLQIGHCVRSAARERHHMVLPVAGASARYSAGPGAGVYPWNSLATARERCSVASAGSGRAAAPQTTAAKAIRATAFTAHNHAQRRPLLHCAKTRQYCGSKSRTSSVARACSSAASSPKTIARGRQKFAIGPKIFRNTAVSCCPLRREDFTVETK